MVSNAKKKTRPSSDGSQIAAKIVANRLKRLAIAEAMKSEAGVTDHTVNKQATDLSGLAWTHTGNIRSPLGRNQQHLVTSAAIRSTMYFL